MAWILFLLCSVLVFCVSARALIYAIQSPIDLVRLNQYSRRALRVERGYKVFAWTLLTIFLFYSMAVSVWQSLGEVIY